MEFLTKLNDIVWGIPTIVLIMGVGIMLSFRLGFLQFRKLGKALNYMWKNEDGGEGEVTSFGALCTALSATIGTGNIVGVATALIAGGPGALFWMIIAACFGMATKYAEGLLAIKYRDYDKETGHALGGPFLYIEKGMGTQWRWLAKCFALFGVFVALMGIGTMTQVNGIVSAAKTVFDPNGTYTVSLFGNDYSWATLVTAVIITVLVGLVIIGGIQRIASVTTIVVPFMAIAYIVICGCILIYNFKEIPSAIGTIVSSAFGLKAAAGGALGAMLVALQKGVARGIFSNEAGLGSAPIAAAAAQTKECVRQGLVSMTGTFIDTICICTMTGLAIVVTGAFKPELGLEGVNVTIYAFGKGLPWSEQVGAIVLLMCLSMFAYTTILGWNYYGARCLEYLVNSTKLNGGYNLLFLAAVILGPFLSLSAIWTLADIVNGLMAIPNLIGLFALSGVVVAETKSYFKRLDAGEVIEFANREK
ncbi:MAG: sodium:alanine symporter family protein [Anaerovoracaceae bacterium]